jgi:hypothetical protein
MNRTADINEATKRRTTVWDVNPRGVAANDITSLTEELLWIQERQLSVIPLSEGDELEEPAHAEPSVPHGIAAEAMPAAELQHPAPQTTQLN